MDPEHYVLEHPSSWNSVVGREPGHDGRVTFSINQFRLGQSDKHNCFGLWDAKSGNKIHEKT